MINIKKFNPGDPTRPSRHILIYRTFCQLHLEVHSQLGDVAQASLRYTLDLDRVQRRALKSRCTTSEPRYRRCSGIPEHLLLALRDNQKKDRIGYNAGRCLDWPESQADSRSNFYHKGPANGPEQKVNRKCTPTHYRKFA